MSTFTIEITGIGSELQGVGRLPDSRAAFVPSAIPGETVEIEITRERDRFVEARLLRVLTPSKDRITPVCPHFGICGGCQTQHMTYERSLLLKRQKVYDALSRIGGIKNPMVNDVVPSDEIFGYRNKAEYACGGGYAGMFETGSHRIVDISACPLQSDASNRVFRFVKAHLGALPIKYIVPRVNAKGEMLLTLSTDRKCDIAPLAHRLMKEFGFLLGVYEMRLKNRPAHALDGDIRKIAQRADFFETLSGLTFTVSPQSFFQVNRPQAEKLYDIALALADLKPHEKIADVYCGAGTISLAAAKNCAHVTGIEIVPEAVRDAKKNAEINGLSDKAAFLAGDAADVYVRLQKTSRFDCVIVDPPRKGVDESVINALIKAPAKRIVYVSCNVATLARDVKKLTEQGVYEFLSATPVDMFPLTGHVESVVCLSRERADDHIRFSINTEGLKRNVRGYATYGDIKAYVLEKFGLKVSSLYIAQTKDKCVIKERENYYKGEGKSKELICPPDKEAAIMDAFRHFGMLKD